MNRFFNYVLVQLFVIAAVICIFRLIANRADAASFAGILFLVSTVGILFAESRQKDKKISILALNGIFLFGFCIPIFAIHWTHMGSSLDDITIFGISAEWLHKAASPMMVVCIIAAAIEGIRKKWNPQK